ncbi:hypothetical protein M3Y94_00847200 [Aphelenchoides besseyi]|nr:hypothetical protein M3Y94_00847200 [Aphelenchoides besseyi]
MSTTDVQTDFVTSTQHYGDVVKLQDHWVKHLTTLEIAMISAACFVVLLIILILCSLSAFLIRRYCFQQRLQGTRESFPESQVSVNVGRAIYYKPDQFEHRGALSGQTRNELRKRWENRSGT